MFRRYWLTYIALAVCLIASTAALCQPQPQPGAVIQTQTHQQPAIVLDTSPLRSLLDEAIKERREFEEREKSAQERTESRAEADLIAQEGMETWAFWMLVATSFGACINILTLWFLKKTFDETKRTATAAIRATSIAEVVESARFHALIETLDSQDAFQAAVNYINTPEMGLGGQIRVSYRFKNFGKTQAVIHEISDGLIVSVDKSPPVLTARVTRDIGRAFGADSQTDIYLCKIDRGRQTVGSLRPILDGTEFIWFYCHVGYMNAFKQRRDEYFLYRLVTNERGGMNAVPHEP